MINLFETKNASKLLRSLVSFAATWLLQVPPKLEYFAFI